MKSYRDGHGPTRWAAVLILMLCVQGYSPGVRGAAPTMLQSGAGDEPNLSIQLGHALLIYNVAFSADMRLVLTGGDGGATLWEAASGREIRRFAGDGGMVTSVAFSPDQKTALTGSLDKSVRLWDVETGQELRRFVGHTKEVAKVAFMPDGKSIVSGATSDDSTVRIWEIATGKELRRFGKKNSNLTSLAIAPDGSSILTGNFDATMRLWNVATGKEVRLFKGHTEGINSVAFSPDGRRAVSGGADSAIRVWEVADGREIRQISTGAVNSVVFSPDGRTVLTGSISGLAQLWNVETGAEVHEPFKGHKEMVTSVAFSSNGNRILTGSGDRSARLWDTATGAELMRFEGTSSSVMAAAVSADGRYLVTGPRQSNTLLWDLKTGEVLNRLGGGKDSPVQAVAISPDSRWVATALRDIAILWNVGPGGVKHVFVGHKNTVRAIAFSPDSKLLLTGSGSISSTDNSVRLWDVETGKQVRQIGSHQLQVNSVAFSPDGRFVLSGGFDGQACLWETATGQQLKCVKAPGYVYSVAFSPDGTKFLTGHTQEMYYLQMDEDGIGMAGSVDMADAQKMVKDNAARLWDVATGKELRRFDGHSSLVHSVAFSPDGRFVLLGTGNFLNFGSNTARLFETDTGREIQQYAGHAGFIMSAMFSPDGRQVVTASADSTLRLWAAATGKEICRMSYLTDGTWVVIDPERKFFDTNDLETMSGLQWVMPDDALRPLPVEIFMRDYYEPRLLPRLIAGDKFKPVRSLSELNRVQPDVRIVKLEAAPNGTDTVAVTVEVARAEGKFRQAGREVTRETGVYDLRLFRDGQLVGYEPRGGAELLAAAGQEGDEELQSWRRVTEVRLDAAGKATHTFVVKLPHAEAVKQVEFSAYAFNTDRVKSATARQTYEFAASPAKGRAYLITFGVNNYESPQVSSLLYPANDARSIRDTLSAMLRQNYAEVVAVPLIADFRSRVGETVVPPTKDNLKAVLELLSGREVAPDRLKPFPAELRNKLRAATPDDLVLISFSTHGEADERGNFYLYPHDTGLTGAGAELLRHSISSEELSLWLRDVDAGEMVMILDACYSGAATGANFKPGPMGSRGLGQLAYDKGMRLLAGTQADNVALGSGESLNGLLTTALIRDGLEKGAAAQNGKIRMTGWLEYAVKRVPAIYADEIPKDQQQKVQQPTLFDFGRGRDSVILVLKQ